MSFKDNLQTKITLDRLLQQILSTMSEPPGRWWLDKDLTRELLHMTDLEQEKVRDLQLYLRPLEGEVMEIVAFDNELAIYHTTVADVALRKSPCWREMVSIRNIRKIMNDKDVIISKGKESLKRLHANALALLDLTYTRKDMALLLEDVRQGLDQKSMAQTQEYLDLFFGLLDFESVSLEVPDNNLQLFARPNSNGGAVPTFEHLILFDKENLSLGLAKGVFPPQIDSDLARDIQYNQGENIADMQGIDVFNFLAELALEKAKAQRG